MTGIVEAKGSNIALERYTGVKMNGLNYGKKE